MKLQVIKRELEVILLILYYYSPIGLVVLLDEPAALFEMVETWLEISEKIFKNFVRSLSTKIV